MALGLTIKTLKEEVERHDLSQVKGNLLPAIEANGFHAEELQAQKLKQQQSSSPNMIFNLSNLESNSSQRFER